VGIHNNNIFLRSWLSHIKLVYETLLFVGQGTPPLTDFTNKV
jgi:hypothetical protein